MAKKITKNQIQKMVATESDPLAKEWYQSMAILRENYKKRNERRVGYKNPDNNDTLEWRETKTRSLSDILQITRKKEGFSSILDTMVVQNIWAISVGPDIAPYGKVYSFSKGILTMIISNSPMLLEIRNFYKDRIAQEMRKNWPTSFMPLVKIVYKPGNTENNEN